MTVRSVVLQRLALSCVVILAAALLAFAAEPAPRYVDLSGVAQDFAALRGRIVVVDYWATWCRGCITEFTALGKLQDTFGAWGVQVVGIALDNVKERELVIDTVSKHAVNFPVWLGGSEDDLKRAGLPSGLPATVILDRGGRVIWKHAGPLVGQELEKQVYIAVHSATK